LPKSIPDGKGDDRQLAARPPQAQVMVYFSDTVNGLYQIRPWFRPLRALHGVHPVVVIGTDSRAVRAIRKESGLPAYTISHYSSLDRLFAQSPVRLALYVNHNANNFSVMSFPQLVHVSIMHGDSDKIVSISGQTRAYDFTFVAGQAAVDRLAAYLPRFNAAERCVIIGRPQAESVDAAVPASPVGSPRRSERRQVEPGQAADAVPLVGGSRQVEPGRATILYAPTWEGGTPSAAYSSLIGLGRDMVQGILADQRFRLVYRPHPLTGSRLPAFAEADQAISRLVTSAAQANPAAGHRVSRGGPATADLAAADLLISDVSSLAIDFLVMGRPLAITVPPDPEAVVAPTPLLETTPRLGLEQLDGLTSFLGELLETDPGQARRQEITRYYLGDTSPGAATRSFIAACGRMISLAERDWAAARHNMSRGLALPPDILGSTAQSATSAGPPASAKPPEHPEPSQPPDSPERGEM
jgi:hypothetical protein